MCKEFFKNWFILKKKLFLKSCLMSLMIFFSLSLLLAKSVRFISFIFFTTDFSLHNQENMNSSASSNDNNNIQNDDERDALKIKIRATTEAINFLHQAILEPNFAEVKQICSFWKSYPPELETVKRGRRGEMNSNNSNEDAAENGVSFEELLKEVQSKRKDIDMEKYVKKMLS